MNEKQAEILKNLAWDCTPDQIKAGFIAALQQRDRRYLIQPADNFHSWDNAAIVFLMLGDKEIEPYIVDLLKWLQDYNWPGANWILERLRRVSSEMLAKPLEYVTKLASDNKDDDWLGWMSILITNPHMTSLLDGDILEMLKPFAV